jgi:hypothetical protein
MSWRCAAAKSSSARGDASPLEHFARPKAKNFVFIVWFDIFHYDAKNCAKTGQFVGAEVVFQDLVGRSPGPG